MAVLRHFGFSRYSGNPSICNYCISQFHDNGVTGAEIPVTLLFADIRGSTGIGERLSPTEFHEFLRRFYALALDAVMAHDGLLDKFVGDEVVALFFGGVTGPEHAAAGIAAGRTPGGALRPGRRDTDGADPRRRRRAHRRGVRRDERAGRAGGR